MMKPAALLLVAAGYVACDVPADLVDQVPGYPKAPFKVYSGYLTVPGPFKLNDYDELKIHYQLDVSQRSEHDPVVTWHQGGPGGSSLYGAYTEMGYFQVADSGPYVNPNAWNKRAQMLYLESPAGSSDPIGFSSCSKNGRVEQVCSWNDRSQAEAYAHTLMAFFKAFPEFKSNALYLTGESYAGQYIPNIAYYITENMPTEFNLKGIAVGNGCWGGTENTVSCNGPNALKNDVDLFYGHAFISKKLRDATYEACGYDGKSPRHAVECLRLTGEVDQTVGPHNVYNVYDNCKDAQLWSQHSGKTTGWLRRHLRENMNNRTAHAEVTAMGGGYDWACGGMQQTRSFFERREVREALHLDSPEPSQFSYQSSGPASVTLYPTLVKKMRVLIYNGDADSCVPYNGNEEWTTGMAKDGVVTEQSAWHPWFTTPGAPVPAGYATTYNVTGHPNNDFTFITIRLAGHMVPTFQSAAAYSFFDRFLSQKPF